MEKLLIITFIISSLFIGCGKKNQRGTPPELKQTKREHKKKPEVKTPTRNSLKILEISPQKNFILNFEDKELKLVDMKKSSQSWKEQVIDSYELSSIQVDEFEYDYFVKIPKQKGQIHFHSLIKTPEVELLITDKKDFNAVLPLDSKVNSFNFTSQNNKLYFKFRLIKESQNDYFFLELFSNKVFLVPMKQSLKETLTEIKKPNILEEHKNLEIFFKQTNFYNIPMKQKHLRIINHNNIQPNTWVYIEKISRDDLALKSKKVFDVILNSKSTKKAIPLTNYSNLKIDVKGDFTEYINKKRPLRAGSETMVTLPTKTKRKIQRSKDINIVKTKDSVTLKSKQYLVVELIKERGTSLPLVPINFKMPAGQSKTVLDTFYNEMQLKVILYYLQHLR